MAKQGRNERCRCGSGLKAKYCCDSPCGPSADAADRSFLARAIRDSIPALVALRANGGPSNYIDDVLELPAHFPELVVSLPALVDPELDALLFACEVGDGQAIRDVIAKVSRRFHTVAERTRLARVVVRLRDEQSIDEIVAVLAGFLPTATTIPVWIAQAIIAGLFVFSYVGARSIRPPTPQI